MAYKVNNNKEIEGLAVVLIVKTGVKILNLITKYFCYA